MNKWIGIGRLTADPEVQHSSQGEGMERVRFALSVDRKYKKDGETNADFIRCVAFGKTAELIEKFFKKGDQISVVCHVQTGSYTNRDNVKVYTTDFVVDEFYFCGKNSSGGTTEQQKKPDVKNDGFAHIPDMMDDPFM